MKPTYRLNEFAKLINRSVKTLQKLDRLGKFKAHRTATNRRYYTHNQYLEYMGIAKNNTKKKFIVYYRVSSASQKNDMQSQRQAIEIFCTARGLAIDEWFYDIGSGLNYKRKKFLKLMDLVEAGEVSTLIIAHKDRLVRFGFEWFQYFCEKHGTEIVIMNQETLSPEQEMTQDLISIIHTFSCRLYGLRKYKKIIRQDVNDNIKPQDTNKKSNS
ncbi:IS607 family transposase [Candidatus Marithrix sp. Canyon 246]|uniref:IS607 family transposase n=6 Tax=Candidatus Marithrix sp. Canyon 246 TaxID=1827136 RepID=UPI00084A0E1B|nr:IS607 family transposase [Candidatus Marithrix sp. Canyon 246]